MLLEGAVVTVPRTMVDYVVTEHGIAHLRARPSRNGLGSLSPSPIPISGPN
jgi:acyl-CoA hydrolase